LDGMLALLLPHGTLPTWDSLPRSGVPKFPNTILIKILHVTRKESIPTLFSIMGEKNAKRW
jgi:hypothetical protein